MRNTLLAVIFNISLAVLASGANRIAPGSYTFQQFPNPFGYAFGAQGINDFGTVVGYDGSLFGLQGFRRSFDGDTVQLVYPEVPPSPETAAWGVNNLGTVVGVYYDTNAQQYSGFFYKNGQFRTYNLPGLAPGSETAIHAINDLGDFGGFFYEAGTNRTAAFLSERGRITTFSYPAASFIWVAAINNAGEAAGTFQDSQGYHGFIRTAEGRLSAVDVPGGTQTQVQGLNQFGWISGYFYDSAGVAHGFVRSPAGRFVQIDVPGAFWTIVGPINDWGVVAGTVPDTAGNLAGFIATPQRDRGD